MSKSEPAPQRGRACRYCGGPIPASKQRNAVYCSPECGQKQWYQDNREKSNAASKKWHQDNHEKAVAYRKQWHQDNREKAVARNKKWYDDNREKKVAYEKAYSEGLRDEKQSGSPKGILAQKRRMLTAAKARAAKKNLPFNLTLDDFELPATCPVLGTEIILGADVNTRDQAPSLDRVIPALGYVKGNVLVISARANRIKNDATVLELRRVAEFFENHINENWMKP